MQYPFIPVVIIDLFPVEVLADSLKIGFGYQGVSVILRVQIYSS